jgi:hypothetical protein
MAWRLTYGDERYLSGTRRARKQASAREVTLRRAQSKIRRGVDPAREQELVFHGSGSRVRHEYKGKLVLGFDKIAITPRRRTSASSKLLLPSPCTAGKLLLLSISSIPSIPYSTSRAKSIPCSSSTTARCWMLLPVRAPPAAAPPCLGSSVHCCSS